MKTNILIGQSGGPTAAINASLSGVIREAVKSAGIGGIYGMLNGVEGLLERKIIDLRKSFKDAEDFGRLAATPAMALGSCRYKLPPLPPSMPPQAGGSARTPSSAEPPPDAAYGRILQIFRDFGIGMFFYIGGNDSMDTVRQLSAFFRANGEDVRCVGVPKTVDNDLRVTDHTPGFGSAAKYIACCVAELALDSSVYDMFNVIIVEIMGRNAGWLTAAAALARDSGCAAPQLIYLPESPFDPDGFIEKVKAYSAEKRLLIAAVSEGVRTKDGQYLSAAGASRDTFGHAALAGAGKYLENLVKERLGCKVRSIELSVLQRSAGHYASATDIAEAMTIGEEAVRAALAGKTGVMMTLERVSDEPYLVRCGTAPVEDCANLEKTVPAGWIVDGCDVGAEMLGYLRPLVKGRARCYEKGGAPEYLFLDKTIAAPAPANE
ncbi:MAG: 6-phosphofructokinase [Firmicutes bacterium]|nr:6-phosphofructokinase [Bacillota bacterium]